LPVIDNIDMKSMAGKDNPSYPTPETLFLIEFEALNIFFMS
jgi:hypothetical protein